MNTAWTQRPKLPPRAHKWMPGRWLISTGIVLLSALGGNMAAAKAPPTGFAPTLPNPVPMAPPAAGAIFNVTTGYAPLVGGYRAHNVGDIVSIVLSETTSSTKTAQTKTQRSGSASITPPTAGPFAINPSALNAASQGTFNGQGNSTQTNQFTGAISVTIADVRPNGTALVRGEKQMLLSQGTEWIQFSGIVRLADIDKDNTVSSANVADAHIEYAGNGAITRSAREGWLSKFFNVISPF